MVRWDPGGLGPGFGEAAHDREVFFAADSAGSYSSFSGTLLWGRGALKQERVCISLAVWCHQCSSPPSWWLKSLVSVKPQTVCRLKGGGGPRAQPPLDICGGRPFCHQHWKSCPRLSGEMRLVSIHAYVRRLCRGHGRKTIVEGVKHEQPPWA